MIGRKPEEEDSELAKFQSLFLEEAVHDATIGNEHCTVRDAPGGRIGECCAYDAYGRVSEQGSAFQLERSGKL